MLPKKNTEVLPQGMKQSQCSKRMISLHYTADPQQGLTTEQVRQRQAQNLINHDATVPTKSIGAIIRENLCTLFNLINAVLAFAVFSVGSYKNMLFMGVVLCNLFIGIVQEIRAKCTVDRLSLLHTAKAVVIRQGQQQEIPVQQIVLDDILLLQNGNQAAVDCLVLTGHCEVDESFITGESEPVYKQSGDMILSGSFIVSGTCRACAESIGNDTYISSISREAKHYKKTKSEIMQTLNRIIGVISLIIIPVGMILLHNQLRIPGTTYAEAIVQTVAALIGMIPEGLILLTSTVLAVSVVRLARQQVMVQDLYCIESLARVDTICLDKTGTLTQGDLSLTGVELLQEEGHPLAAILHNFTAALEDNNATFAALRRAYPPKEQWQAIATYPFSSLHKWSAVTFSQKGTYILGATEFICPDMPPSLQEKLQHLSQTNRVLLLAWTDQPVQLGILPPQITPVGFILLQDNLRTAVQQTLEYFTKQDINLKVISGDNAYTVSNIAHQAGVPNWQNYIDMTTIQTQQQLKEAAENYTMFGRVTPEQKKQLIQALQQNGHTVAMTGDGVNDVLALRQSDCSIAMAAGTDAARNVSQLVLLDSNFDALPHVLGEGRRSINNIQRSASLFLVKTIYATFFALIFLFVQLPYPFIPIQLTLISCLTIGIPSFLLALEPNHDRVQGKFLKNILSKSLPGGLTIVINLILILFCAQYFQFTAEEISTLCVILTGFTGFLVLYRICLPFHRSRFAMYVMLITLFIFAILLLPDLFAITPLSHAALCFMLCFFPLDYFIFYKIFRLIQKQYHA